MFVVVVSMKRYPNNLLLWSVSCMIHYFHFFCDYLILLIFSLCVVFLFLLFSVSLFPFPFAHCHVLWERHQVVHDQKKFTYTSKQADWQTDSTVNARVHPLNRGPQHRELSKTKHQTGQRGGGGGSKILRQNTQRWHWLSKNWFQSIKIAFPKTIMPIKNDFFLSICKIIFISVRNYLPSINLSPSMLLWKLINVCFDEKDCLENKSRLVIRKKLKKVASKWEDARAGCSGGATELLWLPKICS